jgi:DNA-binding transcriptional LysR family regulator
LRDLQVFLAVVRAGSFGGGGAELGLSQPTVSERITRLERQIGVTLFTRS